MSKIKNSAVIVDTSAQRLKALSDNVPAKAEILINGVRYTRAQLIAIYQASLDTRADLVKSRAQVGVDLAARGKAETNRQAIEFGLKTWVVSQFGAKSNQALEFGYTPRKTAEVSAEARANAVKLAQATRKARNTMGSKQKLAIKGTLPVPTEPADPVTVNSAPVQDSTSAAKTNGAPAAPVATAPAQSN